MALTYAVGADLAPPEWAEHTAIPARTELLNYLHMVACGSCIPTAPTQSSSTC